MNSQQLAMIAERKIWVILINADDEVRGLEPSRVLEAARARAEWLDAQLMSLPPYEAEQALEAASEQDRNRAFGRAALSMRSTLEMISHELESTR